MSGIALAQLGEIANLQAGVGFPVDLQGRSSGDYPVAKVGDISRVGRSGEAVISAADHYIDEGDLARLRARPIPPGSVLFAKIGEAIRQNHRVIAGCALLVDNNAMAAIPTRRVESRYLYHFLRTVDFYGLASATTVPALRKSELERLPVPLPALAEQKRIAGILDAVDALRAKRREALAQLDTLIQSTFLDMFGDPVTNPMGWERKPLGEVIRVRSGDGLVSKDMVPDGRYPVYGGNGISGYHDSFMFEEPRIVLGRVGVYCGAVHLTRPRAWVTDNALYVHTFIQPVDTIYVVTALKMANLNQYAGRSAQPLISGNRIYPVEILIPPLDLQHRFAAIVASVEQQRARQRAHLAELDTLFASVQSRAFRGDL